MKIAFFEVSEKGFERFPFWLVRALADEDIQCEVVLIAEPGVRLSVDVLGMFAPYCKKISSAVFNDTSRSGLDGLIGNGSVDVLVVTAQRIPDSALIVAAKERGIKTLMIQHGLYVPFMKRESMLFVKGLAKAIRYAKYAGFIGKHVGLGYLKGVVEYIRIFIFGSNQNRSRLPNEKINVDRVCVYGEHWRNYHVEQFGYQKAQQVIIGAPDLAGVEVSATEPPDGTVCYIAQTLVEDGRIERSLMELFIQNLKEAVQRANLRLSVRLHPRSDMSLYRALGDVKLCRDEFPSCRLYVGHYSSIISRAIFESEYLLLVDFPGHEIPDYIKLVSSDSVRYDQKDALVEKVGRLSRSKVDSERMLEKIRQQDFYFKHQQESPMNLCAREIVNLGSRQSVVVNNDSDAVSESVLNDNTQRESC